VRVALVSSPDTLRGRVTSLSNTAVGIGGRRAIISEIASVDVLHTSTDPVWNGIAIGIALNLAAYSWLRSYNTSGDTGGPALMVGVVAGVQPTGPL
jgi:hypothetical protein